MALVVVRTGALVALGVYLVFCVVTNSLVLAYRHTLVVRERLYQLNMISSLVSVWAFITLTVADAVDTDDFNCKVLRWPIGVIFMPLYLGPQIARGFKMYMSYKVAMEQMRTEANPLLSWKDVFLLRYKWLNSMLFAYSLPGFLTVAGIIVAVLILVFWTNQTFRPDENVYGVCLGPMIYNVGIQGLFFMIAMVAVGILVLVTRTSFLIKEEFAFIMLVVVPLVPMWIVIQYASGGSWFGFREVHVLMMIMYGLQAVTTGVPIVLVFWSSPSSDGIAIGGRQVYADQASLASLFRKCLSVPELRESFKNFVVECLCSENLIFYLRAVEYERLLPHKRKGEAVAMREMFLMSNSAFEINIDYITRETILRRIEASDVDETLYAAAKKVVLQQLLQDPFQRWLRSPAFRRTWAIVSRHNSVQTWASHWMRRASMTEPGLTRHMSSSSTSLATLGEELASTGVMLDTFGGGGRKPSGSFNSTSTTGTGSDSHHDTASVTSVPPSPSEYTGGPPAHPPQSLGGRKPSLSTIPESDDDLSRPPPPQRARPAPPATASSTAPRLGTRPQSLVLPQYPAAPVSPDETAAAAVAYAQAHGSAFVELPGRARAGPSTGGVGSPPRSRQRDPAHGLPDSARSRAESNNEAHWQAEASRSRQSSAQPPESARARTESAQTFDSSSRARTDSAQAPESTRSRESSSAPEPALHFVVEGVLEPEPSPLPAPRSLLIETRGSRFDLRRESSKGSELFRSPTEELEAALAEINVAVEEADRAILMQYDNSRLI